MDYSNAGLTESVGQAKMRGYGGNKGGSIFLPRLFGYFWGNAKST